MAAADFLRTEPRSVEADGLLPDDVREAVAHARATTAEAQRLASVAADEYRQAVRGLVIDRGMSKADVAALLQISQQRVSQLVP